ncbi:ArsB/NhaD family transporter [Paenarthrobacter sp. AT5]|uniref:SLC13 family permease n=1 Tax=Paenarthrobacter TaxID=1742992 RepID=UPI001A980690|nr:MULTISPECIES: SLC13 family permease [Paenarthrobacter]QSZ55404.1 arsenic transporter [Paenarthrobacter ureafaciens]WOC59584.1 ArsB/NhaD family transporter [Paenarthrobacter sp. AT5]
MRLAIIGAALLAAGAVAVVTGILPWSEVQVLIARVGPIMGFVAAMTVVTDLASDAGVFQWGADRIRRRAGGRSYVLWLLLAAMAVLSTIFLSIDTTAVLLTPVVVTVTRQTGLPVLPFALATVWLANTASLLLPVSNLTNLLAQHNLDGISPAGFATLMWASSLAAIIIPLAFIALVFRRDLQRRYAPGPKKMIDPGSRTSIPGKHRADRILLPGTAAVLLLLLPALVSGLPVWLPASIAAVALLALFGFRRPRSLTINLVPWSLLLFTSGLFLVMEAARYLGLPELAGQVAGRGEGFPELLRLAATGALASNVVNNLPAYLLVEPLADTPLRTAALLIGVNAGPLITPWASLATLLWHDRLRKMNVLISWRGFALYGMIVAPVTLVAAVALLALMARVA